MCQFSKLMAFTVGGCCPRTTQLLKASTYSLVWDVGEVRFIVQIRSGDVEMSTPNDKSIQTKDKQLPDGLSLDDRI